MLSGGVAKGVYEAGAACALGEAGYAFDVICGTSIGALNGALLAQGGEATLSEIWHTLAERPILQFVPAAAHLYDAYRALTGNAFVVVRAARALWDAYRAWDGGALLRLVGAYDPSGTKDVLSVLKLDRIATPFMCAVTNLDTGRAEAFYARPDGTGPPGFHADREVPVNSLDPKNPDHVRLYPEIVRSSGALPGAFAPVALPGFGFPPVDPLQPYRYSDGGIVDNTPVRLARKLGVTDMIVVFLSTGRETAPRVRTLVDMMQNLYAANQTQLLDDELSLAIETRNALGRTEHNASKPTARMMDRVVNIYQIRPSVPIPVPELGFNDQAALDAGFEQGLRDGRSLPVLYEPPDNLDRRRSRVAARLVRK